jgi:CRISPR-associated DxTHG motif protein
MTAEQSSRTGDRLVLVTSVGVGRYEEVTYRLEGFPARKCRILPEALADWLKPDLTLVLLTSEAKKHKNWNELEDALKKDKRSFEPVDIPDGKDKDELWKIFDELKEHLKPGDRVVLDITHAFRSLPVLTLLALTYLRVATGIVLERILYGAFEARDEAGEAPVFDLTPFVSLLQWSAAVSLFRQTGECGPFADLLKEEQDRRYRSHIESRQKELPTKLKNLASDLKRLSTALGYLRTKDIGLKANELVKQLRDSKRDLKDFVRPFELLATTWNGNWARWMPGNPWGSCG